jgi:predicted nucleotidyltransferase
MVGIYYDTCRITFHPSFVKNSGNNKMKDKTNERFIELASNNHDIEVLWLYGSRARQTHHNDSDYDLAVAFKSFIDDPLDSRLRPELLAMDWQEQFEHPISIIDINKVPIPLAFTVIVDDSPVYIGNGMRKLQEESRIMSMWELDYEYSREKYG